MHTVVIRRDVYEKHPWVAQSLYKAFVLAQRETYEDLYEAAALKYMLPWLLQHVEETRSMMGDDFWPYGFEPNVHALETFLRYSHEQGLSKRLLEPARAFRARNIRVVSRSKRPIRNANSRNVCAHWHRTESWWIPERGDIDVIVAQLGFNLAQMVIPVFLLLPLGISLDFGVTHFLPGYALGFLVGIARIYAGWRIRLRNARTAPT